MALTGNVTWDIVDGSGQAGVTMGLEGVLEELDESIIDKRDLFPHIRDAPWIGGGGSAYSMVLLYSKDTYPDGGPQPSSWADYLDDEAFPGYRGMIPQRLELEAYGPLGPLGHQPLAARNGRG